MLKGAERIAARSARARSAGRDRAQLARLHVRGARRRGSTRRSTLVQRALKIEPDNPSFLDSLGWAYFQQGRSILPIGPLTDAAAKLQNSSVVQDHLGDLRFKQGRYRRCRRRLGTLAGGRRRIDRSRQDREEAPGRRGRM